jgi:hypothetical protein
MDDGYIMDASDENTYSQMQMHATEQQFVGNSHAQNYAPLDWNCGNTVTPQNFAQVGTPDDLESPGPFYDRSEMPSTREPSPEPLWRNPTGYEPTGGDFANQIHAQLRHLPTEQSEGYNGVNATHCGWNEEDVAHRSRGRGGHFPRMSSGEASMQRGNTNPFRKLQQMVIMVPTSTYVPMQGANVMFPAGAGMPFHIENTLTPSSAPMISGMQPQKEQSPQKPNALPSDSVPAAAVPDQKPEKVSGRKEKEQNAVQSKQSGKAKTRGNAPTDTVIDNLSAEQKTAICAYIYDLMVQKNFTSPDGYLIIDICSEVLKDMGESDAQSWRTSQTRFGDLLRCAPQYFRVFRKSIRISNACGWYTRKGQKMVSLVLDKDKP